MVEEEEVAALSAGAASSKTVSKPVDSMAAFVDLMRKATGETEILMVGYVSRESTDAEMRWLPASEVPENVGELVSRMLHGRGLPEASTSAAVRYLLSPIRADKNRRAGTVVWKRTGGGKTAPLSGVYASAEGGPLLHDTDVGARYRQGPGARDFDVRLRASEGAGPESSRLVEGSGLWSDRPGLAVEFSVRGLLTKGRWFVLRRSMRVGSDGELAYIPAPRTPAGRAYRIARDGYDAAHAGCAAAMKKLGPDRSENAQDTMEALGVLVPARPALTFQREAPPVGSRVVPPCVFATGFSVAEAEMTDFGAARVQDLGTSEEVSSAQVRAIVFRAERQSSWRTCRGTPGRCFACPPPSTPAWSPATGFCSPVRRRTTACTRSGRRTRRTRRWCACCRGSAATTARSCT